MTEYKKKRANRKVTNDDDIEGTVSLEMGNPWTLNYDGEAQWQE